MKADLTETLDAEWLRFRLETDARHATALLIDGKSDEADAYLASVDYDARLQQWKAIR